MIPVAEITRWRENHPWSKDAQVEQDLVSSVLFESAIPSLVICLSDSQINSATHSIFYLFCVAIE